MYRLIILCLGLLWVVSPNIWAATVSPNDADSQVVSTALSPRVAFAVHQTPSGITLVVDVATLQADGGGTTLSVGLSATKTIELSDSDAQVTRENGSARYTFTVPSSRLVGQIADWSRLRMGMSVSWKGGPHGLDQQRERFRHLDDGATNSGLSSDAADWMPLDLSEFRRTVADEHSSIAIPFTQPMTGKATIVIDDAQGHRVRNIISGKPMDQGSLTIKWDGLDDLGNVVPPGTYHWKSASHPGITPKYLFSYCNDDGPNHTCLEAATASGDLTFFAAPVTEGGYAIMALNSQGVCQQHYTPVMGTGIERVALAADGNYLYAAHDGAPWSKDSGPILSITRFDIKSGDEVDYAGGQRFVVVKKWDARDPKGLDLGGLAVLDGKLYIADQLNQALIVMDAGTCTKVGEITLPNPGALTAYGDSVYAVSGAGVVKINAATQTVTPYIADPTLVPEGVTLDSKGNCYVSDGATSTVHEYDSNGKAIRTLGTPGGQYKGAYDKARMIDPRGLAVASNGWLWVTEQRWTPKRLVAWDLSTNQVAAEHFGPTGYGAGGGGFDSADSTRWIGLGCQWRVNLAEKTATPISILGSHWTATHYTFVHRDGRTFLIGFGGFTSISELLPDGSVKDLAFIGSTHRFSFAQNWQPPQAFIDAFNTAYPGQAGKYINKGPGVLWVDRNGDGEMQAGEFSFSTAIDDFAGAYWGHDMHDLTLRVPETNKGKAELVVLTPQGYYPGGAPKYPSLNDACLAGTPIALDGTQVETTIDRFGDMMVNSDPQMTSFAPDGTLRWTYPNQWTNVGGSHSAPLPEIGVMQGALFFLGVAPLDAQSDVFMVNGNHGRFFVLTSDGLYLDEMFKDVRLGGSWDEYMIGGECFGGFFARSAVDGHYYLQSGSKEYRIFRIDGLDQVVRQHGTVIVTPEQAAAAERNLTRNTATVVTPKVATVPRLMVAPTIDGKQKDWPGAATIHWDKSGQFPVTVSLGYDASNLYVAYNVDDPSPWINGGSDWTLLFKTGDSVNLELGADEHADPLRTTPVPGDIRLLIAPYKGKPTAVLYQYRIAGATHPVTFTSPWRSEIVDSVRLLSRATIAVVTGGSSYRVEASIPLSDLGWTPKPRSTIRADVGVLYGDPDGTATMLRSYWSNQATGLVNDVPGEIMLFPNMWGSLSVTNGEGQP